MKVASGIKASFLALLPQNERNSQTFLSLQRLAVILPIAVKVSSNKLTETLLLLLLDSLQFIYCFIK